MIPCVYKRYLGVECMGCGFQRSMKLLVEGDLIQSILLFPAGIPTLLTFLFLIYHIVFKPTNGPKVLTFLFLVTAFIMVSHFVFKMIL